MATPEHLRSLADAALLAVQIQAPEITPDDLDVIVTHRSRGIIVQTVIPRERLLQTMRIVQPKSDAARHSPDYRSVHWHGQDYIFTPTQAAVVRLLWESWEDGNGDVGQETLLEAAGSESKRLRDLFKDHPAWGNVIRSCGKGIFSLEA